MEFSVLLQLRRDTLFDCSLQAPASSQTGVVSEAAHPKVLSLTALSPALHALNKRPGPISLTIRLFFPPPALRFSFFLSAMGLLRATAFPFFEETNGPGLSTSSALQGNTPYRLTRIGRLVRFRCRVASQSGWLPAAKGMEGRIWPVWLRGWLAPQARGTEPMRAGSLTRWGSAGSSIGGRAASGFGSWKLTNHVAEKRSARGARGAVRNSGAAPK